jgi:hypothetical protein
MPAANAQTYDLLFSDSLVTGSFTWDPDSKTFQDFTVSGYGYSFDFDTEVNITGNFSNLVSDGCSTSNGQLALFNDLTTDGACADSPQTYNLQSLGGVEDLGSLEFYYNQTNDIALVSLPMVRSAQFSKDGTYSVTPAALPEPGALTLLFANLAVVAFLARKRIALGYRQYMRTTCEPPPSH